MAVSKRTRFEVLKRDSHACRYCGQCAPDVKLTVDHVMPKALGGRDDPSNLVAACVDCNAGKSSSTPDAVTVADVQADALKWAERTRQAYAVVVEDVERANEYVEEFREAWTDPTIERGWQASIARFYRMGVPIEMVVDAARRALSNVRVEPGVPRFKYMCGILWNQISVVTDEVALKASLDGAWVTESESIDQQAESYYLGKQRGDKEGRDQAFNETREGWAYMLMLWHVCDGLMPGLPERVVQWHDGSVVA